MVPNAMVLRCGYGEISAEGVNPQRLSIPGARHPGGTIQVAIPKLRPGQLPSPKPLAPRGPSRPSARVCASATWRRCHRRMDEIVKTLAIEGISRSPVSRVAKTLDVTVEGLPQPRSGRRARHLHQAGRSEREGARGRTHRQRGVRRGHGRQRQRQP